MKSTGRKRVVWAALLAGVAVFILYAVVMALRVEPTWKFIIVGDSRGGDNGVNTAVLKEIAAEIVLQEAEFVLFPGDLVNGSGNQAVLQSQLTTWRDTMQPVYDAGIGVYPVRGNHDAGNLAAWQTVFSGEYALPTNGPSGEMGLTYSVSHKNVFVLALDQYISRHRVNQPWVDAQLAANTNPHIFAFGHEPAFKLAHADCLDDYPAERDAFLESLKNAGCRVYACGHDHFFDHAVVDDGDGNPDNDIHQYVVGTAGAPLYGFSPPYNGNNTRYTVEQREHAKKYGYLLVEVDGSVVTRTWFEKDTQTGTYGPPTPPVPNTTNAIPYAESFESYAPGFALPGSPNGTNGWYASGSAAAVISTNAVMIDALANTYSGGFPINAARTQVLRTTRPIINAIDSGSANLVTFDGILALTPAASGETPDLPIGEQTALFLDSDGRIHILHGDTDNGSDFTTEWLALADSPVVGSNEWMRVTVLVNYTDNMFQVRINDGLPLTDSKGWNAAGGTQPGTWFYMADRTRSALSRVSLSGKTWADDWVVKARRRGIKEWWKGMLGQP